MKWIYNRNLIKVFKDLGEQLHNDVLEMSDVDLFEDRIKFIRNNIDPYNYKSNDKFDKDNIYAQDLHSICILIAQLVIFGRIVVTDYLDSPLFPKNEIPSFMNIVEKQPNHSTGQHLKKKTSQEISSVNKYKTSNTRTDKKTRKTRE